MTQLVADGEASLTIDGLLLVRELLSGRPALRRTCPAGQLPIALLRILMTVTVNMMDAGGRALRLEPLQLLHVIASIRNQAAADGEPRCFVNEIAVYTAPIPAGSSYVVAREVFKEVKFKAYAEGRFVSVSTERVEGDFARINLRLTWALEVTLGPEPATELLYGQRPTRRRS